MSGFFHSSLETIVPIVVTTANLQKCVTDPEDIDPDSGFITKDPVYEKLDSVIYECPIPKSVRFPQPDFNNLSADARKQIYKWPVLIVSPKGFTDFIKQIR